MLMYLCSPTLSQISLKKNLWECVCLFLFHFVLVCFVSFLFVLFCFVLFCSVLYFVLFFVFHISVKWLFWRNKNCVSLYTFLKRNVFVLLCFAFFLFVLFCFVLFVCLFFVCFILFFVNGFLFVCLFVCLFVLFCFCFWFWFCFCCWFTVVLGLYRYFASFVQKFLRESTYNWLGSFKYKNMNTFIMLKQNSKN